MPPRHLTQPELKQPHLMYQLNTHFDRTVRLVRTFGMAVMVGCLVRQRLEVEMGRVQGGAECGLRGGVGRCILAGSLKPRFKGRNPLYPSSSLYPPATL